MPHRVLALILGLVLAHAGVLGAWRACVTPAGGETSAGAHHAAPGVPHGDHHRLPADGHDDAADCRMVTACGMATVASAAVLQVEAPGVAQGGLPAFDRRAPARAVAAPEPPPPRA